MTDPDLPGVITWFKVPIYSETVVGVLKEPVFTANSFLTRKLYLL